MEQTIQYLEFLKYGRKLSDNTIKSIEHDFKMFGDQIETASRRDVELFVIEQNKQDLSTATINRRIASLKGFFEWQLYNGYREGLNPAGNKIAPKITNKSHEAISRDELDTLYNEAPTDNLKAAIALMGYAGLRLGEVTGIGNRNPIYKDSNEVYAVRLNDTKGGKQRDVTLGLVPQPELIEKLVSMGGIIGTRGLLSENGLWRQLSKYFKSKGYADFSPHGLRATFTTISTRYGVRVDIIRDTLGHAGLDGNMITSRYVSTATVEQQYEELKGRWNA